MQQMLLLAARSLLALVFAVAAAAKLADRKNTSRTLVDFGLPQSAGGLLAILLPVAEFIAAIALILSRTAWAGGIGALFLLSLFTAAIAINLARGHRPECRCFGQLHSKPVGWLTIARNAVLAGVAAFIVSEGRIDAGPSVVAWISRLKVEQLSTVLQMSILGLVGACVWLLVQMLAQQGRILLRLDTLDSPLGKPLIAPPLNNPAITGLPIGSTAPGFHLPDLEDRAWTLADLQNGKLVLLLFVDPGCNSCSTLLPQVRDWQREYAAKVNIALISRGNPKDNRTKIALHAVSPVLLQQDHEVATAYHALMVPSAVLLRPDGTIGSAVATGPDAIRAMMMPAAASRIFPSAVRARTTDDETAFRPSGVTSPILKVGDLAPAVSLPSLDGGTIQLSDFHGNALVLLFWNPDCGFCQKMLPNLEAWDKTPPPYAPKLLVLSTGSAESNSAMHLRSPVVIDAGSGAANAFGARGTPMAVLIDRNGRVASTIVAGPDAVLALLQGPVTTLLS